MAPQTVLDGLGVGIVVVDTRCVICYRNRIAAAWLEDGDHVDAAFARFRTTGHFDGWSAELERVASTGAIVRFEGTIAADSSRPSRIVEVRCSPLPAGAGQLATNVAILIEQNDRSDDLQEPVEVSRRLASLGKLAARVAHELNNPLDGILRYVNLALRLAADAPEPRLQSYLAESRTGLMRMVQIIGELLQFSRASDAGFENMNVNDVVEEAVRASADAAEKNNIIVTADFQRRQMPVVRGSRLYQVCCNLIRNAVDAMPEGGRLTLTTGVVDSNVVIRVSDTGVGLPEPIEKAFEPFFTTKPAGKGTGLGLAISRDLINDLGGSIEAAQGAEGGAVFTVRIPIKAFSDPARSGGKERSEK